MINFIETTFIDNYAQDGRTIATYSVDIDLDDFVSLFWFCEERPLLGSLDIYGYRFQGSHFDVGIPLGLLKASVYEALKREALKDEFRSWLNEII